MEPLSGDDPAEVAGYRLRARLGAGGMGRVYLAFTAGGRPVALKVVRPELGDDSEFRARFRQEVAAAKRVHGLYTAQVLDADPEASPPWLLTAYVPGPSLQQAVADHGPLPVETVFLLIAGVAEALQAIHAAGLVHRDLKPSNVLLAADGPRVIDFGIARAIEATAMTRTGMRIGSPAFMAPEQAKGQRLTPATDVFAVGSLATYAALCRTPFGEGSDAALLYRVVHEPPDLGGCPPALRGLIERCLAKTAEERPSPAEILSLCRAQTAGRTLQIAASWLPATVSADLAQHAAPAAPVAEPTATITVRRHPDGPAAETMPVRGRIRRWPLVAGAAAVVLAVAIAAGAVALFGRGNTSSHAGGTTTPASLSHTADATQSPAALRRSAASVKPTTPATPATPARTAPKPGACLIGTWKSVHQSVTNTINSEPVQFTGGGETGYFRANGTGGTNWGNGTVFSADVDGVEWTDTVAGKTTVHWTVQNGEILLSDVSSHGTITLRDNGAFNEQSPLSIEPGPTQYTCSGDHLREFFPNGSAELVRITPARRTTATVGS